MFGETSIIFTIALGALAFVSLSDIVRNRATLFSGRFTEDKRSRILRFVMFVLLPLSVLLHEGGHALAVLAFGGEVVDFGFYLFYGFVGHVGRYTPLERGLISFAGPAVNIVTGLAAFAWAWFRPGRPQVAFLLFAFAASQLANALIFYPLVDAGGGVAGDWETIYSFDVPAFSAAVAALHVVIVGGGVTLWRMRRFHDGYSRRTALADSTPAREDAARRAAREPFLVHEQASTTSAEAGTRAPSLDSGLNELSGVLSVAAALAAEGWRHPTRMISDAQVGGAQVILRWESGGFERALLVHTTLDTDPNQHVEIHGAAESQHESIPPYGRPLARVDGRPNARELVPYIRRFLDYVDSWDGSTHSTPN